MPDPTSRPGNKMQIPPHPFVGPSQYYDHNIRRSASTLARPAFMDGPDGRIPAVGLFFQNHPLGLLTLQDATRLSAYILRSVEAHGEGEK